MLERVLESLFRRWGCWYPTAFVAIALQGSWVIALATVAFLTLYVEMTPAQLGSFLVLTLAVTGLSVLAAILRAHRLLGPVRRWLAGDHGSESSVAAWRATVELPLSFWRHGWYLQPLLLAALPMGIGGIVILDQPLGTGLFICAVATVAIIYAAILNFFIIEVGMRPLVAAIAADLPARVGIDRVAVPLRWKLFGALPAINLISGFLAVGLSSSERDVSSIGLDAVAAIAATFVVSAVLTLLVARSLRRPLRDMLEATARVRDGDFDPRVLLTTSDEVGELGAAFNQMVAGLSERERFRAALGTYLDPMIATRLLDDETPLRGEEVEVTVLFVDVRDFTAFAASRPPSVVVAALNRLYDAIVPIIARHGGHVDKFIGDGLLAVFGAPGTPGDHADRALGAALAIGERVRAGDDDHLAIGIGVSSGRVLVGNVGGGGRLDFSVIGDAVNVAARAEAATRVSGDTILITDATRRLLVQTKVEFERGPVLPLEGKRRVALYTPRSRVSARSAARA